MITRSSGFSLVELLVVVAIVGILSATGMVLYSGYIESAKRSAAKSIMQQIALAQSEEYANSGSYFKTSTSDTCTPTNPADDGGSGSNSQIEDALFDSALTIARDGDFGFCIAGGDTNDFVVIGWEFKGGVHSLCTYTVGRRGGIDDTNDAGQSTC